MKKLTQLEAIYREALENIKNTLDGCGMRQDEEMPLSELLLLRVAREALSAQGEQGTDQLKDAEYALLGWTSHHRKNCECNGCAYLKKYGSAPTPTAQEPPTETQERCPKCKTEVEWVVPPIPGVKPFFQCQDPDCNWMSDDDFPVTESKEGREP